jgi:uncharacterized protein with von Willebrand factor type A (vWA) domain
MACECEGSYDTLNSTLEMINSTLINMNTFLKNGNEMLNNINETMKKTNESRNSVLKENNKNETDILKQMNDNIAKCLNENKDEKDESEITKQYIEIYKEQTNKILKLLDMIAKTQETMVLLNVELNVKGDERVAKIMGENMEIPSDYNEIKNNIDKAVKIFLSDIKKI